MRLTRIIAAGLLVLPAFTPAHAAPAVDVALSSAMVSERIDGTLLSGETRTYRFVVTNPGQITFSVAGENLHCGTDLSKASQRGVLTTWRRFPASFTDNARAGETYTMSFFQSREAWINKTGCTFSFSISP
ncbi:hypothetical protein NOF55_21070 [Rhizobiaceae bacterium BDR2-2]|uniref:Uncharacterized protein n=1 Tax=Ectorhizobium quercum TaxID=2965071 RepID=A0AAE3N452_9HYPH|nr:hypothetical protein [Ectorhizobium quercum]MCX8999601.1 hypothetical protein [Ectorhizobium quercum]